MVFSEIKVLGFLKGEMMHWVLSANEKDLQNFLRGREGEWMGGQPLKRCFIFFSVKLKRMRCLEELYVNTSVCP